jgi:hypothetical protein
MPTPSLVPDFDGEGLLGTSDKRWSGVYISGHVNSRGQNVSLKYFVADAGTRYALTGLTSGLRPEAGDLVFQYSPTGLFLVLDSTILSGEQGYREIGKSTSDILTNPTLYGTINFASGTTGVLFYLDSGKNITYSTVKWYEAAFLSGATGNIQSQINGFYTGFAPLNSPIFISGITTPQCIITGQTPSTATYFDSTGKLTSSNVTIVALNFVSGASGNIQTQINNLRSSFANSLFLMGG